MYLKIDENTMKKNQAYFIEIFKNALKWFVFPNLILFVLWQLESETGFAPSLTLLFNIVVLPLSLLITTKSINEKHLKNWWHLNFILFSILLIASVYLNLLNWILSAERNGGIYGRHNIDNGTWMIINLELTIGFAVLGIGLLYFIFIGNLKNK